MANAPARKTQWIYFLYNTGCSIPPVLMSLMRGLLKFIWTQSRAKRPQISNAVCISTSKIGLMAWPSSRSTWLIVLDWQFQQLYPHSNRWDVCHRWSKVWFLVPNGEIVPSDESWAILKHTFIILFKGKTDKKKILLKVHTIHPTTRLPQTHDVWR